MLVLIPLLTIFGQSTINMSNVFLGNWNVTEVQLEAKGVEASETREYIGTFSRQPDSGLISGAFMATNDLDDSSAKYHILLAPRENETFQFSFSAAEEVALEPGSEPEFPSPPIEFIFGLDDMVTATGSDGTGNFYSINVLSTSLIEVTVFNSETKATTIYRCIKEVPVQQRSIWTSLLPMMPMLLMMMFNGRGAGAPQAAAPKQKQD
jgi:hypothetical protein